MEGTPGPRAWERAHQESACPAASPGRAAPTSSRAGGGRRGRLRRTRPSGCALATATPGPPRSAGVGPQYPGPPEAELRTPRSLHPGPRAARARRVHQLRLLPSRWCLGFSFCVALRKLPVITAAERKRSPVQRRSSCAAAYAQLGGAAGAQSTRFRSPAPWPPAGALSSCHSQ